MQPEIPTTHNTKPNTYDDLLADPLETKEEKETLATFGAKITNAKSLGKEWVETTKEIIDRFNPTGLNGSKYFWYNGVKVCEHGLSDQNQKVIDRSLGSIMHGDKEGILE